MEQKHNATVVLVDFWASDLVPLLLMSLRYRVMNWIFTHDCQKAYLTTRTTCFSARGRANHGCPTFPHIFLLGFGAAYGTAKSGVGLTSMGVLRPDLIMKGVVPIIMAGIIGIYGLVVSVLIGNGCMLLLGGWTIVQSRNHLQA